MTVYYMMVLSITNFSHKKTAQFGGALKIHGAAQRYGPTRRCPVPILKLSGQKNIEHANVSDSKMKTYQIRNSIKRKAQEDIHTEPSNIIRKVLHDTENNITQKDLPP